MHSTVYVLASCDFSELITGGEIFVIRYLPYVTFIAD